jgi:hypothetical protein
MGYDAPGFGGTLIPCVTALYVVNASPQVPLSAGEILWYVPAWPVVVLLRLVVRFSAARWLTAALATVAIVIELGIAGRCIFPGDVTAHEVTRSLDTGVPDDMLLILLPLTASAWMLAGLVAPARDVPWIAPFRASAVALFALGVALAMSWVGHVPDLPSEQQLAASLVTVVHADGSSSSLPVGSEAARTEIVCLSGRVPDACEYGEPGDVSSPEEIGVTAAAISQTERARLALRAGSLLGVTAIVTGLWLARRSEDHERRHSQLRA